MEIKVSKSLQELADIFYQNGSTLYIVGGYVRNAILGFCETDIDLCGDMLASDVRKILDKNLYKVVEVNKKLGTIHIHPKYCDDVFEYTTFRSENYSKGGKHSPDNVVFVKDIKLDASRRDFTANAIYYDIKNKTIIDFYDGVNDVNNRILKTVETPEYVFESDGLRMLRLVRIASELDFSVDEDCFNTARDMISQLSDISRERFNKEIVSILFADYKYEFIKNPHASTYGLNMLSQMGAWKYILPKLCSLVGEKEFNKKLNKNWVQLVSNASVSHRITAFVIDLLNVLELPFENKYIDSILGQNGIVLQKDDVALQTKIILGYNRIVNQGFRDDDDKRYFIQQNSDILDSVLGITSLIKPVEDLVILRSLMIIDKVPMSLKELNINGNDLIEYFPKLDKCKYSAILKYLLRQCCLSPELNEHEILLNYLKRNLKNILTYL